MKVGYRFAVIVAGGQGTRMQNDVPKQFIEISGKPVLVYSLERSHVKDVIRHRLTRIGIPLGLGWLIVGPVGFSVHKSILKKVIFCSSG